MVRLTLTILLLSLLALPADAARKRKKHRAGKRRAPVVRTCPPPVVRIVVPDRVEFISQSEEENLHAAIAAWMKDQPEMSEAAAQKAREIAEKWARWGMERWKR